jgi:hypoxanthine-guanine phosphoribosyltransferase
VTNARELAQLTETLKQKVQAKYQRIQRYGKGKTSKIRIRCLKKILKIFTETWA